MILYKINFKENTKYDSCSLGDHIRHTGNRELEKINIPPQSYIRTMIRKSIVSPTEYHERYRKAFIIYKGVI